MGPTQARSRIGLRHPADDCHERPQGGRPQDRLSLFGYDYRLPRGRRRASPWRVRECQGEMPEVSRCSKEGMRMKASELLTTFIGVAVTSRRITRPSREGEFVAPQRSQAKRCHASSSKSAVTRQQGRTGWHDAHPAPRRASESAIGVALGMKDGARFHRKFTQDTLPHMTLEHATSPTQDSICLVPPMRAGGKKPNEGSAKRIGQRNRRDQGARLTR
eukprot:scaffold4843_cov283-Prasinococcus_capsulatus_cf.AAC.1